MQAWGGNMDASQPSQSLVPVFPLEKDVQKTFEGDCPHHRVPSVMVSEILVSSGQIYNTKNLLELDN